MNAKDILELVRAGYTRAEIENMDAPADEAGAEEAADTPDSSIPPLPTSAQTDSDTPAQDKPAWAVSLEQTVASLITTMQAANRAASGRGEYERVQTTDDILREMFADPADVK